MTDENRVVIGPIYATPIDPIAVAKIPWAKPIRIYQFVLILPLLILTWLIMSNDNAYEPAEGAFVFSVIGTYLLVVVVDLVSQCGSDPIPDTPMFLFGVVGCVLFTLLACNNLVTTRKDNVTGIAKLLVSMVLAVTCAILFLVDVVLIFLYGY